MAEGAVVLTIAADKEDNKVDTGQNAQWCYSAVSFNAIVHDGIPILTGQYLLENRQEIIGQPSFASQPVGTGAAITMTTNSCRHQQLFTWKTVNKLCQKESKLLLGSSWLPKLNLPPKTCIPNRAKMTINKKRSNNKEAMDWIELSSDATRFDRERQYLF